MKLVQSTGRSLTVRDAGPVLIELRVTLDGPPIKINGTLVVSDDEARALVREQLNLGFYERVI